MIKSILTHPKDKSAVLIEESTRGDCVLVVEPYPRAYSGFYSVSRTTAGTTIIVTPKLSAGIVITDLIMSQEKISNGSITVRFNDGTNTVIVASASSSDAPVNLAIPFVGKISGWKNAWVELITTATGSANATIGFYRTFPDYTQSYTEWLADRAG
jgi:hypothetical protein